MKKTCIFLAFAIFISAILYGTACQREIDTETNLSNNSIESTTSCDSIVRYLNFDTTRKCISKKSHYAEESSVFVYNHNGKGGCTYKTLKLMSEDTKIIQEWFVEYLHSDCINGYTICELDPEGTKYGYFYKWDVELNKKKPEDIPIAKYETNMKHYRLPDSMKAKGFRLPTEKDFNDLYSMYTDPADADYELQFNMFKKDLDFYNYCQKMEGEETLTKRMWIDADVYKHENTEKYGMSVMLPGIGNRDWKMTLYISNNPNELCRIRLMRTLTLEQWEEED